MPFSRKRTLVDTPERTLSDAATAASVAKFAGMGHPMGMKENPARRFGVARVLSKQGLASRTQAAAWVGEGRVFVNGKLVRDPEFPVLQGRDVVTVAGRENSRVENIYLVLNKPRGLLTTTRDEKGRDTVYRCFDGADFPWIAPVGRLDKASEGLLFFTNDTVWAARMTSPETGLDKTYHVQVNRLPDADELARMRHGLDIEGQRHAMKQVTLLRSGEKNAWLEIILDEGKNRQIRKILATLDFDVLRLIRTQIGHVKLGSLAKGQWRLLEKDEIAT